MTRTPSKTREIAVGVWLAWRYCRPDSDTGLAFNGLVHVCGHRVWFPKAFQVIGQVLLEDE